MREEIIRVNVTSALDGKLICIIEGTIQHVADCIYGLYLKEKERMKGDNSKNGHV